MDKLYFLSLSDIFAQFVEIRMETSNALQTIQGKSSIVVEFNAVPEQFGAYLGEKASLQHRMAPSPMRFNPVMMKNSRETFKKLRDRTLALTGQVKLVIVPPSLMDLHSIFLKVIELQMEGYNIVLQILESGDASQLYRAVNVFEESYKNLLIFESMQRAAGGQ
ncbi:MAG: hypothetical protein ABRQ37_26615 [Candidatus Eremiobacterota bacterium]